MLYTCVYMVEAEINYNSNSDADCVDPGTIATSG